MGIPLEPLPEDPVDVTSKCMEAVFSYNYSSRENTKVYTNILKIQKKLQDDSKSGNFDEAQLPALAILIPKLFDIFAEICLSTYVFPEDSQSKTKFLLQIQEEERIMETTALLIKENFGRLLKYEINRKIFYSQNFVYFLPSLLLCPAADLKKKEQNINDFFDIFHLVCRGERNNRIKRDLIMRQSIECLFIYLNGTTTAKYGTIIPLINRLLRYFAKTYLRDESMKGFIYEYIPVYAYDLLIAETKDALKKVEICPESDKNLLRPKLNKVALQSLDCIFSLLNYTSGFKDYLNHRISRCDPHVLGENLESLFSTPNFKSIDMNNLHLSDLFTSKETNFETNRKNEMSPIKLLLDIIKLVPLVFKLYYDEFGEPFVKLVYESYLSITFIFSSTPFMEKLKEIKNGNILLRRLSTFLSEIYLSDYFLPYLGLPAIIAIGLQDTLNDKFKGFRVVDEDVSIIDSNLLAKLMRYYNPLNFEALDKSNQALTVNDDNKLYISQMTEFKTAFKKSYLICSRIMNELLDFPSELTINSLIQNFATYENIFIYALESLRQEEIFDSVDKILGLSTKDCGPYQKKLASRIYKELMLSEEGLKISDTYTMAVLAQNRIILMRSKIAIYNYTLLIIQNKEFQEIMHQDKDLEELIVTDLSAVDVTGVMSALKRLDNSNSKKDLPKGKTNKVNPISIQNRRLSSSDINIDLAEDMQNCKLYPHDEVESSHIKKNRHFDLLIKRLSLSQYKVMTKLKFKFDSSADNLFSKYSKDFNEVYGKFCEIWGDKSKE